MGTLSPTHSATSERNIESGAWSTIQGEDVWIRSGCELCLNFCGILVHRVNGQVVKIEGDPENPHNKGFVCAKGNAGMLSQFSSRRVLTPLKRGNPNKGMGVDPQWKEISWDEALDTIAQKLKKIRDDDPRKVYFTTFDIWDLEGGFFSAWANGFGTQCKPFSAGFYCGNNVHSIHLITEGGFEADPDPNYAKYILLVGSQFSSVVNYHVMGSANAIAQRRPGDVKIVALDPVGSYAASKAEEWIPIRPGTDAAFLLAVANLLINELNLFDAEYLKRRTNAPYLVGQDGLYCRDAKTGKPLVWDASTSSPKLFDDPLTDFVLDGVFAVDGGQECKTAFRLLKEHLSKYTLEYASKITTIDPSTIRRIAGEFGKAAGVGSTIEIKGKKLPYRPACVAWYRGLSSHKHSFLSGLSAALLNVLVGAVDVPGGSLATQQAAPATSEEGLLTTSLTETGAAYGAAYPPRKAISPKTIDLFELFPVAVYSRPFFFFGLLQPEKYRAPYQLEMLIQTRSNFVKTSLPRDVVNAALKKIPFMVSITMELDETAEFADIVLPDLHYLERLCFPLSYPGQKSGEDYRFWNGQRPVVEPPFKTPWGRMMNSGEILMELARRGGFLGDIYNAINFSWGLKGKYKLDPNSSYSTEELFERRVRATFGEDKDLKWYLDNALVVKENTPEQMYPGAFSNARVHVYYEFMKRAGADVSKITKELGMDWWDVSDYQPLPEWKPCPAFNEGGEFDLYLVNYKVPQQPFSYGQNNGILQALTDKHRDDDILINSETARRKGIKDGDAISIETSSGRNASGRARVTELVHPEVVACQGQGGRFARSVANRRGINYNDLLVFDEAHVDFVSAAVDSCVRVKIRKA
ncbi:MAG TPA: molybdopterin-dependent oxidoreductase [Nitrososphaerales archaeon]|nr:molybdopterin-dependent oxidoreductase [Nitrososphaerales archaeon]